MSAKSVMLRLADIDFAFSGLTQEIFNPFFQPFIAAHSAARISCAVEVDEASTELESLHQQEGWHFTCSHDQRACVTGSNSHGSVLWRITGQYPFEILRFECRPTVFNHTYLNQLAGPIGIMALMALVMRLLPLGGMVLHGSAQKIADHGIVCTGPSGAGKSTISRLFDQRGIGVLSDERPIIRPLTSNGADWRVYGSPWPSSAGLASNDSAPLRKIYFLEHGSETRIEALSTREGLTRLLEVALVPWIDQYFFDPLIQALEGVLAHVPCALLRFTPDDSAIEAIKADLAL